MDKEWQVLTDISLVAEEQKRLKAMGKVVTNYPLIGTEIEDRCSLAKVLWLAETDSVSVLVKEDDLYRLYFMTAEPMTYKMPTFDRGLPVITEIYEKSGKERCSEAVASLLKNGFEQAKRYDRYEIKLADIRSLSDDSDLQTDIRRTLQSAEEKGIIFGTDKSEEAYRLIYDCFEPIGAQLPFRSELQSYKDDTEIVTAHKEGELVAAAIYRVKSGIATEEYVYTPKEYRGQGYSALVEAKLISEVLKRDDVRRLNAWVEEKNIASLRLHGAFEYTKTSDYKLTLVTYQK